jgi:hypothetical protein
MVQRHKLINPKLLHRHPPIFLTNLGFGFIVGVLGDVDVDECPPTTEV